MPSTSPVYRPRKPQDSQYYQCVQDHFETLEQVYDERFAKKILKHLGLWDQQARPPPKPIRHQ